MAGLFTASWLARWAHVIWSYPGTGSIGFTYTQHRIDAVLAGALAAWLVRTRHGSTLSTRARAALAGIAIACFLPTLSFEPYDYRVLFLIFVLPLQAIGFGCLLVAIGASFCAGRAHATVKMSRGISAPLRLLAFVGVTSYSTYLWHMPFADVFDSTRPGRPLPAGAGHEDLGGLSDLRLGDGGTHVLANREAGSGLAATVADGTRGAGPATLDAGGSGVMLNGTRTALIVAHPGHELRIHGWLERTSSGLRTD